MKLADATLLANRSDKKPVNIGDIARRHSSPLPGAASLHEKVSVHKLNFFYEDGTRALKDVSVPIYDKRVTAFIGPSGCGKSTLLRVFNRMYDLYQGQHLGGEVLLNGKNILAADYQLERLRTQIQTLLDAVPGLPEERLAQELALLAAKGDVREELDRLAAHIGQARDMLTEGGAIGRRLDFLSQEFNRESNTLCSKSQDVTLTRIGVALKTVIDQFREQIQNVE